MQGTVRITDYARPQFPLPLRLVNASRPLLRALLSLEPDALIEAARRKTGLDDFGPDSWREPFGILVAAIRREADLSGLGIFATRNLLLGLLANRLLLEDLLKRHPEIHDERIERPLIIAGLPRTGTTHLHNLISADPSWRTLPYWESLEPIPDPREKPRADGRDPRVARCEQAMRFQDWAMPLFKRMHEMPPDSTHEEIQLLAMDFSTMLFESAYRVPTYREWYKATDQTPAYRYLARVLRALQWLRGPKRWALKSPQHLEQIRPLVTVFPDAYFVQTHRDPLRITVSLLTMLAYGHRINGRNIDPLQIGRDWSARCEDLLRASALQRVHLPKEQTLDVVFSEFMKDDLATVERVYAFARQPLTAAGREAIARYVATHPRGLHGTVVYDLADFGVDAAERRRALRFYQERFAIADE
ncbi:MAG: sulfotransferase [Deltaproteobacteria bacterium]|nr:sulfotransferase [Deltaproteobacteria bacterium]